MTRINDYLWHLPHETEADDPPEIAALIAAFSEPIIQTVGGPLAARGYDLSICDVMVKLGERLDNTLDTYYANVRFVKYLQPNIMTRVHFEHTEWALFWPQPETHHFFINLDRFKTVDATRQAVPAWEGRLHTRLSNLPGDALFFEGMDQQWTFTSPAELSEQLAFFLDKFERLVISWLEDLGGIP
jgi:hypothetical protein